MLREVEVEVNKVVDADADADAPRARTGVGMVNAFTLVSEAVRSRAMEERFMMDSVAL